MADAVAPTALLPVVTDNCGNTLTPTGPVISVEPRPCEGNIDLHLYLYRLRRQHPRLGVHLHHRACRLHRACASGSSTVVACVADAVAPTALLPVVTDNCGDTLTPTGPVISVELPTCEGNITYTYTYTDCEGNTHDWVYTYTIERADFTVPHLRYLDRRSLRCRCRCADPLLPVVTDNCGNTLTPTGPVIRWNSRPAKATSTYTYTYTDCEGNTHDWVYTYTIERETSPCRASGTCRRSLRCRCRCADRSTASCNRQLRRHPHPDRSGSQRGTPDLRRQHRPTPIPIPTAKATPTTGCTPTPSSVKTSPCQHLRYLDRRSLRCRCRCADPLLPVVTDNCGNTLTPTGPVIRWNLPDLRRHT